jgi:tRNA pseudouridine38-40 synthase
MERRRAERGSNRGRVAQKPVTRNIKLTLEYDGTDFHGFQFQPSRHTIQEALEKALSKFYNKPMKIGSASGRTDAGVHAKCQVVHFKTDRPEPLRQIQKGLNAHLPHAIAVRKAEEMKADFHARFHTVDKTYEYCVWNDEARSPFWDKYSFHVSQPLSLAAMRKAAKVFIGRHDFRSFCATEKPNQKKKETVRMVTGIVIKREGSLIRFRFTAEGFLHHMVRNMVGALIEAGRGKLTAKALKEVLDHKDRRRAAATAPAKGLTLIDVTY